MGRFDIDSDGLAELEGGDTHRLAFEPVANVFDEYRGYVDGRKRPTFCEVTIERSADSPRGILLTVTDDGAGFANERDIWTMFAKTPKRDAVHVAGRFNAGDKQLIATARRAVVKSGMITVLFIEDNRQVTRHREIDKGFPGTRIEALMPWSIGDMQTVAIALASAIPPSGLRYSVNGDAVLRPDERCTVKATLPTVKLIDGVMRPTTGKTAVHVLPTLPPTLFELGIPICSLEDIGFPFSLDVQQKVPVPMSRNAVSAAYIFRLIGTTIEQAAMDGVSLLTEDQQGAPFIKGALDWIREPEALKSAVQSIYGDNAVRQSSDPLANAQAVASGAALVPGRYFTADTRRRMDASQSLPTASTMFPGSDAMNRMQKDKDAAIDATDICPTCGGFGRVPK